MVSGANCRLTEAGSPIEPAKRVNHETIYRAIYAVPKGEPKKELRGSLPQAGGIRRPRSRGEKRGEEFRGITPIDPTAIKASIIAAIDSRSG